MSKFSSRSYIIAGTFLAICGSAFAAADLPTSQARARTLQAGESLLGEPQHIYDGKLQIKSPFSAKVVASEAKAAPKTGRPSTDAEFLQILAAKLNPTGVLMLGDQALLLFGEKKVKVGETIKIPFDKDSVDVELVDLSGTSFTLRLNNEQLTRPIKPGK
ncbi:MAG TPA: hypothetical protein VIM69_11760 [Opitutaceae bacterium]